MGRVGEPRADRKTVPIIGPLYSEGNAKRLFDVMEYGLRNDAKAPEFVVSVAPQIPLWGATTLQRDMLSYLRRGIAVATTVSATELRALCLFTGRAEWYVDRAFDEVHVADACDIPAALELLVIQNVAAAALVHAPIGASSGYAVPLGWASFDSAARSAE